MSYYNLVSSVQYSIIGYFLLNRNKYCLVLPVCSSHLRWVESALVKVGRGKFDKQLGSSRACSPACSVLPAALGGDLVEWLS